MEFVMSIWEKITLYRQRRKVGKVLATLKNFRHTDEDILDESELQALDSLIAQGVDLQKKPAAAAEWQNQVADTLKLCNPHGTMREYWIYWQ